LKRENAAARLAMETAVKEESRLAKEIADAKERLEGFRTDLTPYEEMQKKHDKQLREEEDEFQELRRKVKVANQELEKIRVCLPYWPTYNTYPS